MINIFLVDDQESVRRGLKMRLALEEDLQVVGDAADGKQALDLIQELRPDVVIMDIEMPRMDGISAAAALHDTVPEVKVVMLSLHDSPFLRDRARKAGAIAFVEKREGAISLLSEIRNAYEAKRRQNNG
ncbi:MAG TPA: response regulator transcription factor [Anaerolineales bacterium]|nr:response regulator transcription factor [Anaerolineales bacterium]